jgi:hypothetical protein
MDRDTAGDPPCPFLFSPWTASHQLRFRGYLGSPPAAKGYQPRHPFVLKGVTNESLHQDGALLFAA